MKLSSFKFLLFSFFFAYSSLGVFAQDNDGIYGDIYQAPEVEQELMDTTASPLDGYSTVDDYYPEEGYTPEENSNQTYSEQYVDENGNNVTNNYYGDYYEDGNDYSYASRINRFHRPMYNYGYYNPYYTNMYYYNNDPYYWGTSIYIGYQPSYSWGYSGWGWNYGWGWNSPYYSPACYGGGYGYGYGGSYWGGNNHGYNHGFNDGLAYGGYYNTYDSNSGMYYGHRGSTGNTGSTIGTGYRGNSLATAYNKAAKEGKVMHANRGNVLETADARPVKGNLDGYRVNSTTVKSDATRQAATPVNRGTSERTKGDIGKESTRTSNTATRGSVYERDASERVTNTPQREAASAVDRTRYRATTTKPRSNSSAVNRGNTYQRGNEDARNLNRQPAAQPNRSTNDQRGNMYQDIQRTQPNSSGYDRNNTNRFNQPQQGNRNDNRYVRPSNDQPSRNATSPSRNYQQPPRNATTPSRGIEQPSRNATPSRNHQQPSRSAEPSRNVSPSPNQNKGSSKPSFSSPSPSRSSGSFGGSRGSSPSPSRGSSTPSRGGRP